MRNRTVCHVSLIVLIVLGTTSFAQEHDLHDIHGNESHGHNNHLALFIGNTSQHSFETNSFTLGLDYMYFFPKSEHWGISVFGEIIMGEHTEWLFGLPVVYKFNNHFWLRSGFGIELVREEHDHKTIITKPLFRLGAGYDIQLKKITLSPSLDIDIIRKHPALVAGINIGYGF